jgi:hypothetical protein
MNQLTKLLINKKKPEAQLLAKLIKYGIRPQELNKMTIKNIREHPKEGWHIDFGVAKGVPVIAKKAKGQTKPNAIPIPEALAKEILNFAGNKKTPIFNKDLKIDKMAAKKKIAMEVFGKDYIDYNLNRNLLRTKAGEVKIFVVFTSSGHIFIASSIILFIWEHLIFKIVIQSSHSFHFNKLFVITTFN